MFDAAFIKSCADRSVPTEIVERFIAAVGTENPLAISITSDNSVILPEPPTTADDAVRLAQRFVGYAVVRAGVTAFPAGVGISHASQINADLFDTCKNITMGTALFGKVYRIVAHAHDAESEAVLRDAIEAWRTGTFEGQNVFHAVDPARFYQPKREVHIDPAQTRSGDPAEVELLVKQPTDSARDEQDPNTAGIRIDLSVLAVSSAK